MCDEVSRIRMITYKLIGGIRCGAALFDNINRALFVVTGSVSCIDSTSFRQRLLSYLSNDVYILTLHSGRLARPRWLSLYLDGQSVAINKLIAEISLIARLGCN
jgi:hypothetical protein